MIIYIFTSDDTVNNMELKDNKYYLIDLDGVILDTSYDNHFWQIHIPDVYAKKKSISMEDSIKVTHSLFNYKKKTKDWYDIDYWSNILDIDIKAEKEKKENMNRMSYKEGAIEVLNKMKKLNKELYLVTNAHKKTLEIKLQKFHIKKYFKQMICSHELGYIKEDIQFWHVLRTKLNINYSKSLLIEDTMDNISSAYHACLRNFIYITDEKETNNKVNAQYIKAFSELASSF